MLRTYLKERFECLSDLLVALSLANLCLISSWFTILYDSDFGYFNKLRVTGSTLLALLCNFVFLATAFWMVVRVLRRTAKRFVLAAGCLAALICLVAPAEFFRVYLCHISDRSVIEFMLSVPGIALLLAVFGFALWRPRQALKTLNCALLMISPMALFTISKTGCALLHSGAGALSVC